MDRGDGSSYVLENLIIDGNLNDVYKSLNLKDPGYTWSNGKSFSQTDFLFVSKALNPISCEVELVPF